MVKRKANAYPKQLKLLMAEKSRVLSQAEVFEHMGLPETAQPLWTLAATYEERIAPRLDVLGRDDEAALHRVSGAACYEKSGELTRAANLYRAALAGPFTDAVRSDVEDKLSQCLKRLSSEPAELVAS